MTCRSDFLLRQHGSRLFALVMRRGDTGSVGLVEQDLVAEEPEPMRRQWSLSGLDDKKIESVSVPSATVCSL